MSRTTRTFLAIEIPADRAEKLGRLQSLVAETFPGARWVAPDQFHVTLAFLGDVDHADLATICRVAADAARAVDPFAVRLEGLGVFPDPSRPRAVWVGLTGGGLDPLVRLHRGLIEAIEAKGYPPEDRRFTPHVTLGRVRAGKGAPEVDPAPALAHFRLWSAGSFPVTEVVAFASTLTPEGSSYTVLAKAPLGQGKGPSKP